MFYVNNRSGELPRAFRCYIQNWKVSCLTPLDSQPGFRTQHCYEAPGDFQVETSNAVINIRLVRLPLDSRPQITVEQPNSR